jgi:hypothetical protein
LLTATRVLVLQSFVLSFFLWPLEPGSLAHSSFFWHCFVVSEVSMSISLAVAIFVFAVRTT